MKIKYTHNIKTNKNLFRNIVNIRKNERRGRGGETAGQTEQTEENEFFSLFLFFQIKFS